MFTEKEANILQALIEDEMTNLIVQATENDPLLKDYHSSLSAVLLKIKMDNAEIFHESYRGMLCNDLMSRQRV